MNDYIKENWLVYSMGIAFILTMVFCIPSGVEEQHKEEYKLYKVYNYIHPEYKLTYEQFDLLYRNHLLENK